MNEKNRQTAENQLTIAISSRALFDMDKEHSIYLEQGVETYCQYQIANEDEVFKPGAAFSLVKKLLALNEKSRNTQVEVILLSRNSADSGLRIFNSIYHHNLSINKAVFTNGQSTAPYAKPFGAQLFLSADPADVRKALDAKIAAATIIPSRSISSSEHTDQVRIAFDGDAVIFSDEAERVYREKGLEEFNLHEKNAQHTPLPFGPFTGFLLALQKLQSEFSLENSPIRTALVTARGSPSHARVIHTLRNWKIRIDESMFLHGLDKGEFLRTFNADIFFDDNQDNCQSACEHVTTGHVPHGIANEPANHKPTNQEQD